MLKVSISAVTSNNLKCENHNPGPGQGERLKNCKCPNPTGYVCCFLFLTDQPTFTGTFQNSVFKS